MATTSGKSKASCSAANAALPSASTRPRPWHRCRPTARRRTSSSPARHLTPALPTVPPVLLKKTPPHTKLRYMYTWLTDTQGHLSPSSLNFELLSANLYCISTSDLNHGPWTFVRTRIYAVTQNQMHNQILEVLTAPLFHLVWHEQQGAATRLTANTTGQ